MKVSREIVTAETSIIGISGVVASRSVDVGDGDERCNGEPVARGHLVAPL
jgi:hypothetical protein